MFEGVRGCVKGGVCGFWLWLLLEVEDRRMCLMVCSSSRVLCEQVY